MSKRYRDSISLQIFLAFWLKHAPIENFHKQWAREHAKQISAKRQQVLYDSGTPEKCIYFVCKGMIALIEINGENRRIIKSIAAPFNALKTTSHLHSDTPRSGKIVALRASKVLRIAYSSINKMKEMDPLIARLVNILVNKKMRQQDAHIAVILHKSVTERVRHFRLELNQLALLMTQQEQADYLGISRRALQKSLYALLTSKSK
ncbi:Crp/Fnr family transcriptional regulator [Sphingobacterium corticis]|uniref:Crp/Fnr family transcriptional regulator n=1 Tax=Sphingobacterium corticis TaxID=1812823 RepID=A0ABW5NIW0_9SPHI